MKNAIIRSAGAYAPEWVLSNQYFKEFLRKKENYSEFDLVYYYERARYYQMKQNEGKQFQSLQKAISAKNEGDYIFLKALFEISKIYLYNKKDAAKAKKYLLQALEKLNNDDLDTLKLKAKSFEVLIDSYRALAMESEAEEIERDLAEIREKIDHLF